MDGRNGGLPARRRVHVVWGGECQAVGFRWTSREIASKLMLTGWVRNLEDGTVEMELQGPDNGISSFFGLLTAYYKRWGNVFYPVEKEDVDLVPGEGEFSIRL